MMQNKNFVSRDWSEKKVMWRRLRVWKECDAGAGVCWSSRRVSLVVFWVVSSISGKEIVDLNRNRRVLEAGMGRQLQVDSGVRPGVLHIEPRFPGRIVLSFDVLRKRYCAPFETRSIRRLAMVVDGSRRWRERARLRGKDSGGRRLVAWAVFRVFALSFVLPPFCRTCS